MSFVGKLIIVCQVAFSFVFMAFAGAIYTAQLNWKTKADGLQEQMSSASQQMTQQKSLWEAERSELQNQFADLESRAKSAEDLLADKTNEFDGLKKDYSDLKTIEKTFEAESGISKEEAKSRTEEAYSQRDVNRKMHSTQEQLIANQRKAEDTIFAQSKQLEAYQRKHMSALEEIATWKLIAQENNWVKDPSEYARSKTPPPEVKGYVIVAKDANDRGTERLVEISLGERDGLVEGHILYVYRPSILNEGRPMYLGSIRLVNVTPNRAVGTVIQKAPNGTITKDDHVTTQL